MSDTTIPAPDTDLPAEQDDGVAYLAGGCFWCTEGVFERLPGVKDVVSGYAGGSADTANYEATCRGDTGHAELVKVEYDPARISYGRLLRIFFGVAHDPTQLNRQGNDRGTQYRSAIFYETDARRDVARAYIGQLDAAGVFGKEIATTLEPLADSGFHEAEGYHQDFAKRNPAQPYVACTVPPKLAKLGAYLEEQTA